MLKSSEDSDIGIEVQVGPDKIDHLLCVLGKRRRTIVCTTTNREAENLAEYLSQKGYQAQYLHSEIAIGRRNEIVNQFSWGKFSVLVVVGLVWTILGPQIITILDPERRHPQQNILMLNLMGLNSLDSHLQFRDLIFKPDPRVFCFFSRNATVFLSNICWIRKQLLNFRQLL